MHSICIVLLLRHKYSASLQHRMLVALVFRHLRYFGPSGRIGPVSTYQLTKKLKFWLTKGNAPIKLLVYTFFKYFIDTTWHVRILMLTKSIEAALIASTFIFLQGASIDPDCGRTNIIIFSQKGALKTLPSQ